MINKSIKPEYIRIPLLTVSIFLFQEIIGRIGWKIAALFDLSSIDKDNLFMAVSLHHIFILLFSFGIIFVLHKIKGLDFKIKPKTDKNGIKYTVMYCAAILVYYTFVYIIGIVTNSVGTYDYELNAVNLAGTLGFQLFLSGPSEEILFRALPLVCLKSAYTNGGKVYDILIIFLTSLLFTYAHINFNVPIFYQLFNLLYVFINGIALGFVFIKTKSVVYPMIMHSVSNFISVGGCYLYMILSNAV